MNQCVKAGENLLVFNGNILGNLFFIFPVFPFFFVPIFFYVVDEKQNNLCAFLIPNTVFNFLA